MRRWNSNLPFPQGIRPLSAVLLFVSLSGRLLEPKAEEPSLRPSLAEPGREIFATNAPVLRLRIEIGAADLESLHRDPRKFVPATVREGNLVVTNAAVHLKGAAGSFRPIHDKPALTLSFGKLASAGRFHDLRKIHLNNSVQDPSYSTEDLCGGMFRAAGVPAPRVTNARVWLNGRDLGFYVLIEGFTREFLGRYFRRSDGNLYDGGFLKDVTDILDRESDHNNEDESDLKALAAAAQEPDPAKRWERLNQVLDVGRFISFMAIETLVWDWDGYVINRNNYRIYHDPGADRMVFMPHGMDQMFWEANGPLLPNFGGLVASALIHTPDGHRLYRQRLEELFHDVYRLDVLTNRLEQLHSRNRPAVAEIGRDAVADYDNAVDVVRDQIVERWIGVKKQLDTQPATLPFDQGAATLTGWSARNDSATAKLDRPRDGDRSALHIAAAGDCTASWRTRVLLDGGRYRFEGQARTVGVVPLSDGERGEGAGLRISGSTRLRANKLAGESSWSKLEFEFEVAPPGNTVELICELRSTRGEVWFDIDSLRLVRLRQR